MTRKLLASVIALVMIVSLFGIMPVSAGTVLTADLQFPANIENPNTISIDHVGSFNIQVGVRGVAVMPFQGINLRVEWEEDMLVTEGVTTPLSPLLGTLGLPSSFGNGYADVIMGNMGTALYTSANAPTVFDTIATIEVSLPAIRVPGEVEFDIMPADDTFTTGFVTIPTRDIAVSEATLTTGRILTITNHISQFTVGSTELALNPNGTPVAGQTPLATLNIDTDALTADSHDDIAITASGVAIWDGTTQDGNFAPLFPVGQTFTVASGNANVLEVIDNGDGTWNFEATGDGVAPGGTVDVTITITASTGFVHTFILSVHNEAEPSATGDIDFFVRDLSTGEIIGCEVFVDGCDCDGAELVVGRRYRVYVNPMVDETNWLAIPMQFNPDQIRILSVELGEAFDDSQIVPLSIPIGSNLAPYTVGVGGINADRVNALGAFLMVAEANTDGQASVSPNGIDMAALGTAFVIEFEVIPGAAGVISILPNVLHANTPSLPNAALMTLDNSNLVIGYTNRTLRANNPVGVPPHLVGDEYAGWVHVETNTNMCDFDIVDEAVEVIIVYNDNVWMLDNGRLIPVDDTTYLADGTVVRMRSDENPNQIPLRAIVRYADGPNRNQLSTNQTITTWWASENSINGGGVFTKDSDVWGDVDFTALSPLRPALHDSETIEIWCDDAVDYIEVPLPLNPGRATIEIVSLDFRGPNHASTNVIRNTAATPQDVGLGDPFNFNLFFAGNAETVAEGLTWEFDRVSADGTVIESADVASFFGAGTTLANLAAGNLTFTGNNVGTYRLRAISNRYEDDLIANIYFIVGRDATITISGAAMLAGKQRSTLPQYGFTNIRANMDAGILVQLIETDDDGVETVITRTMTNTTPMHAVTGATVIDSFNSNFSIEIPLEVMEAIIAESDPEYSRFMLRFSRLDRPDIGIPANPLSNRAESYLVSEIVLYSDGAFDMLDGGVVIENRIMLIPGAFVSPGPNKFDISIADVNTIRGVVGRSDEFLGTTIFNINEYLGVDGGDFSTVLGFLGRDKNTGDLNLATGVHARRP